MKTHTFVVEVSDPDYERGGHAYRALEFRLDGWDVQKLKISLVKEGNEVTSAPVGFFADLRSFVGAFIKVQMSSGPMQNIQAEAVKLFTKYGEKP